MCEHMMQSGSLRNRERKAPSPTIAIAQALSQFSHQSNSKIHFNDNFSAVRQFFSAGIPRSFQGELSFYLFHISFLDAHMCVWHGMVGSLFVFLGDHFSLFVLVLVFGHLNANPIWHQCGWNTGGMLAIRRRYVVFLLICDHFTISG